MLPAEFVGTSACLVPLVQLMCAEMGASFSSRGLTCPPWRHAKSLLSKWLPSKACPLLRHCWHEMTLEWHRQ